MATASPADAGERGRDDAPARRPHQLEGALAAYRGALVVVSHDERFLDALGVTRRLRLEDGRLHDER